MATTLQERFVAFLASPRLPLLLACVSTALMLPSLGIGFHLDDHIHRYLLSDRPGAAELRTAYESPFGIATGDPAVNHWQIEQGYAPWWTEPKLLVSLYRPLSELSHRLDAALWPNGSVGMHLHSLLWHFLLVLASTWLYLGVGGRATVPAVAALLYALDHTHGFATGWIANRNALIAACLGATALGCHVRWRRDGGLGWMLGAVAAFGGALLSGEGAIAVLGFVCAHALFLDRGGVARRLAAVLPSLGVVVAWRVAYVLAGRGAVGSGLYLDPMREPLRFAAAAVERVPVLLLGELALPPAEIHVLAPAPWPGVILVLAVVFSVLLLVSAWPLLRSSARARFWALGSAGALVVACSTHPHNRLLFFAGLGVMGLLSELWHGLLDAAAASGDGADTAPRLPTAGAWRRVATPFTAAIVGFHLFLSPLLVPISACSVALTAPAERGARQALAVGAGRELVLVSSPDFFYAKLVPVIAALEERTPPRRLRALSFGPVPLELTRDDARSLRVEFVGGLLSSPLMELYRAADSPMPVGTRVALKGMTVEVTRTTPDGRVAEARFVFDGDLDAPGRVFLAWDGAGYARFRPPAVGQHAHVAPAELALGL